MPNGRSDSLLIRLRPCPNTLHIAQDRAVIALDPQGWIQKNDNGFFVHETRMCSRYRVLIDGSPPQMNVVSNVQQHSWMGYYIVHPPENKSAKKNSKHGGTATNL